jgi:hypothetical protein
MTPNKPFFQFLGRFAMFKVIATRKTLALIGAAGMLAVIASSTMAQDKPETQWQKDHPRRTEVNTRLANQNQRIHNQVKDGDISKARAANLHKQDHQIRQEERDMASQNGGHVTKQEQTTLNQQENSTSRKIGQ